jgi:Domain of unknown function (DUF4372)
MFQEINLNQEELSAMSGVCRIFSRAEFGQAVRQHKAEHQAQGFSSWSELVAMLFCQLGRAQSLREICGGVGGLRRQVEASGGIRALSVRRWPTRMNIGGGSCTRPYLSSCCKSVSGKYEGEEIPI